MNGKPQALICQRDKGFLQVDGENGSQDTCAAGSWFNSAQQQQLAVARLLPQPGLGTVLKHVERRFG